MERKKLSIILLIITIIFTIIGGSLAYYNWQILEEQKTNITFTVAGGFSCAADGGGNITSGDVTLFPCECTNNKYAIKREVKVRPTINTPTPIYMDLWLDINELGTGLSNSDNFKYALTTSADSCANPISSGTFKGKTSGDKVELLTSKTYSATMTDTYYLWIWLDKAETSSDTMNQVVNLSLNGNCTDKIEITPDVPDGLIPVTIANDGTVTTISKTDDNWYDYSQKKWANAVLVNQTNRSTYLGTTGETIPESDILAYYVWIPRYKYKIWTTGTGASGEEQEIDIVFQSTSEISTGTQVGEYITHPAFWWDNDGDGVRDVGEELAGFWTGKFRTTQSLENLNGVSFQKGSSLTFLPLYESTNNVKKIVAELCGDSTGVVNNPTIKPNLEIIGSQFIGEQFNTSLAFSGGTLSNGVVTFSGNITYGLDSTVISHMEKNVEWGAVAYLTYSRYGFKEMANMGSGNSWTDVSGTGSVLYGNGTEYSQSTTGNITGVFDMTLLVPERVMAILNGTDPYGTIPSVTVQYFDEYTSNEELTACNSGYCYGHALSEVSGWFGENSSLSFDDERSLLVVRGGFNAAYNDGDNGVSIFQYRNDLNNGYCGPDDTGFRSVLVIPQ